MSFNAVLAEIFARHADAPALLSQDGQTLTFAKLERTVSALATRLRGEGISPGLFDGRARPARKEDRSCDPLRRPADGRR
jgi:non-ribosomal peptide synthetase component F